MRFLSLLLILVSTAHATPGKLVVSCGSTGIEADLCRAGIEAFTKKTGTEVEIFSTPNDSNDRLALYQQLMGAKSSDIDLYQIDVVWPGILSPHLKDLTAELTEEEKSAHFPGVLENNLVEGQLVAIPWFTDGGVLYYRADLLKKYGQTVPRTWEELKAAATVVVNKERAAGNKDMWGYVFQGRAYEGLTCNALEWVSSYGGGTVVEADSRISINNPKAAAALKTIASFMGTLTPQGVLNYSEEEARGAFQSGKAVFMRNWPYAWALLNSPKSPVNGKVGITTLPAGEGGQSAATLGGWGLAVSKYSKHPKEAVALAKFLTSFEEQKRRSIEGSFNPTLIALYSDKDVLKKNPHMKELKAVFVGAVPRPARQTKSKYNRVSADFWNAVHSILGKGDDPATLLKQLEQRMNRYSQGGKWK